MPKTIRQAVTLRTHVNVPDANAASIARGWSEYYWKPLRTCLKRTRKGDRR